MTMTMTMMQVPRDAPPPTTPASLPHQHTAHSGERPRNHSQAAVGTASGAAAFEGRSQQGEPAAGDGGKHAHAKNVKRERPKLPLADQDPVADIMDLVSDEEPADEVGAPAGGKPHPPGSHDRICFISCICLLDSSAMLPDTQMALPWLAGNVLIGL